VTICVVLGPKNPQRIPYTGEYTSGFSGPAASHLATPPSPRYEGNVGQAPSRIIHDGSFRNGVVARDKREEHNLRDV